MTIFHGTEAEAVQLMAALRHNCTCTQPGAQRCSLCQACLEQRWLDRLLSVRRDRQRFIHAEFNDPNGPLA
ncbi:MAG TPA: hypothetical protein VFB50_21305 [Chloroflexota bacterium]|nr:hypothetical protein [Chloroflexota bacterium]